MATVASLNVEIGVRIAELQKGLRSAEKELRASGARLSRAGNEITTSLSLPLALLGGSAIQAAGEFESLRLAMRSTFQNAGRSIKEADDEVNNLRKSALAPGLDFEQAVKASIRLQSVGLSAEKARGTIEELANAIASTGGTADNLSSVTVQFAQIISKGKVLAGDLRIVQENLPIVSDLMQKAFGTSNSEAIQKLGISGKEFVEKITSEMGKLNRVQGGISNAIVNAGSAIKVFLAGIGDEINKVFNLGEKSDQFASGLNSIAEGFRGLSDGTKKFVVELGLALVVLGPAIKIYGALKTLAAQGVSAFGDLTKAVGFVSGKVLQAAKAFQALSVAQKATVIGLAIAAVTALYFAYDHYANSLTNAEVAQKSINDVNQRAAESIAEQKTNVEGLVAAFSKEGATLTQKRNILNELKKISPEYFGTLRVGKGDVEALSAATSLYSAELLKVAKITAAKERLVEIEKAMLGLNKAAEPSALQSFGNLLLSGGNSFAFISDQAKTASANFVENKKTLEVERAALLGVVTSSTLADAATGNLSKSTGDLSSAKSAGVKHTKAATEAQKAETDELERYDKMIREIKNAWVAEAQAMQDALDIRAKEGNATDITPQSPSGEAPITLGKPQGDVAKDKKKEKADSYAERIKKIQQDLIDGNTAFTKAFKSTQEEITANGTVLESVFVGMGAAIQDAAESGASSFKQLGLAAAGAAAKIVRAYIQQGVAAAVAKALSSIPFPFNLAAAAAAGGIAAALFTNLIGKIGVKGFAEGTRDAPGGLSLVGERGPELVNLPKHSQVFSAGQTVTALRGGGSNVNVTGEFRVQGTDLVLVFERTQNKLSRFR